MKWIVRKYVAYLVYPKGESPNTSECYAFEPYNIPIPACFEHHDWYHSPQQAYKAALIKAKELTNEK